MLHKYSTHFTLHWLVIGWLAGLAACQPREEALTTDPAVRLGFSRDTVRFDTLLSGRLSPTRRLVVRNPSPNAVLTSVRLAGGDSSPYQLVVNGRAASHVPDLRILGRDSALVLVTVRPGASDRELPFVVRDSVEFLTNGNRQHVKLLAWGRDAIFLSRQVLRGAVTWRGTRPYVVLDTLLVDASSTLTVQEGVQVYLEPGASMFVRGSLQVQGTVQQPVGFANTRQDEPFRNAPGQWGAIFFLEGSRGNRLANARLRNGTIGLRVGTPDQDTAYDVTVENTIIENMQVAGLMAFTSDINLVNTQVNNCIDNLVLCSAGGHYVFQHCTFANAQTRFLRQGPSVVLANALALPDNQFLRASLTGRMENCILWGDQTNEIDLGNDGRTPFSFTIRHSLVRTTAQLATTNQNVTGREPRFLRPTEANFQLDSLSPAVNLGVPLGIGTDLRGRPRSNRPDAGAYERRD
jgi:hypothetical protein